MAAFRRDLQPNDHSSAANAYRQAFLYDQDDLAEEVRKLRKGAKSTHNRLREMISYGAIRSIDLSAPLSDLMLVELAIFGCNLLLLLPGLFASGSHTHARINFIKEELSLLEALKTEIEKKEDLIDEKRNFLKDMNSNQHGAWLMTLVMSVKTFRTAK